MEETIKNAINYLGSFWKTSNKTQEEIKCNSAAAAVATMRVAEALENANLARRHQARM